MTETSKLKLVFADATGNDLSFTLQHANKSVSGAEVKALMNGMISNGTIYETAPVAITSATMITTTETEINVNA